MTRKKGNVRAFPLPLVQRGPLATILSPSRHRRTALSINTPSDEEADLQIGPTESGMVRIFIATQSAELPLDFTPEDAESIAEDLMAAAQVARAPKKRS